MIMSLWHTDVIVSYIEALIDVRTLKKRCALFARKRSSRHKKFNSKQSSTWILANEILHLFKHLSLEKTILLADKSDNRVLYHVASQIWQLQHGMGS